MDTGEMLGLVTRLTKDDAEHGVSEALDDLKTALDELDSNPSNASAQVKVSAAIDTLEKYVRAMTSWYDPTLQNQIAEIGGENYFSPALALTIRSKIFSNQMLPAVAFQYVEDFISERGSFLESLENIATGLKNLGVKENRLDVGDAEIGFRIPRTLFQNELDGLVEELRAIKRIIRAFAEIENVVPEPIVVHSISTTDPIFFFGLAFSTVIAIGKGVTWSLNTWEKLEGIRKLRAETRKLTTFEGEEDEIEKLFTSKIEKTIDQAIEARVEEVFKKKIDDIGRVQEQKTDLTWAFRALMGRIERGMKIEIKFLPPEPLTQENRKKPELKTYVELDNIVEKLTFPTADEAPVVALPHL